MPAFAGMTVEGRLGLAATLSQRFFPSFPRTREPIRRFALRMSSLTWTSQNQKGHPACTQ
jgi:hypothetical protein